jgi:hypothetical protein
VDGIRGQGQRRAFPIQDISVSVGHKSTHVTETVYRHVIVPAIRGGATVMDRIFSGELDLGDGPMRAGMSGS